MKFERVTVDQQKFCFTVKFVLSEYSEYKRAVCQLLTNFQ